MDIDQSALDARVLALLTTYGQASKGLHVIGHDNRARIADLITRTQHALNPRLGDKAEAQAHITAAVFENGKFRSDYKEMFTHIAIAEQLIKQLPQQRRNPK